MMSGVVLLENFGQFPSPSTGEGEGGSMFGGLLLNNVAYPLTLVLSRQGRGDSAMFSCFVAPMGMGQ